MKYHYVRINRLNSKGLVSLAEWIHDCKFGEVEYNEGGWQDRGFGITHPHLRFDDRQDALQFIIARGGEYSETIPTDELTRIR